MTFSVSRDHGLFEWAGNNLASVFCQPSRLLDPNMWRLLYDVLRFNACARRLAIDDNPMGNCSIGDYLVREGYSDTFRDNYLIVRFSP
jgi:predicted NAD/FAD-binding protein